MAKGIFICFRKKSKHQTVLLQKVTKVCKSITPSNIQPSEPYVKHSAGVITAIVNPNKSILYNGNSFLLGAIQEENKNWYQPCEDYPIGTFALFRDNPGHSEAVSDAAGSRSIWYYLNEELFIASTSQRAIIQFLGSFEFNEKVIPWMLSSGTIGPGLSWDKRINKLPPNSSVVLNKVNWTVTTSTNQSAAINPDTSNASNYSERLNVIAKKTFSKLLIDMSSYVLPISGGGDSRGVLLLLRRSGYKKHKLKTITWGTGDSRNKNGTDAHISHLLTKELGLENTYYKLDDINISPETVINRFIENGEGRIDHIRGYVDGFNMWKELFKGGINGVIRGDQAFGTKASNSWRQARRSAGLSLCSDFSNLKRFIHLFPFQQLPVELTPKNNESKLTYADRLRISFRIPIILSALSDLKLGYVEEINPLLCKPLLDFACEIPSELKEDKKLWRQFVKSIDTTSIPYATKGSGNTPQDFLAREDVVKQITNELYLYKKSKVLPEELIDYVIKEISKKSGRTKKMKRFVAKLIHKLIFSFTKRKPIQKLDVSVLAFRALIICKTHQLLTNEAGFFNDL